MKKKLGVVLLSSLLTLGVFSVPACNGRNNKVSDYYQIDTSSVMTEMLVDFEMKIDPKFTNLGQPVDVNYSIEITLNGNDVTSTVYNKETKIFHPTVVGEYRVVITVLNASGGVLKDNKGNSFSKTIVINVVKQGFEPIDSEGVDVTVSDDGVLTFGEYYSTNQGQKADSGQYRVTGISFTGSYSITYKIENVVSDPKFNDPALYFGWIKDWTTSNDDSMKVGVGGNMSAWIWGTNGDLADLSSNRAHGWSKGGWWDAPGSMGSLKGGVHYITFERYVNKEAKKAVYGVQFDNEPYTYLDVGDAYSDLLKTVWVESINISCSITVTEFKTIDDVAAPTLNLNLAGREFEVGDSVNLKAIATVEDDSPYASLFIPSFRVFDSNDNELPVDNGVFMPMSGGQYKVTAEVKDLKNNVSSAEGTLQVAEADPTKTAINLENVSPVAMPNSGIILYPRAIKQGTEVGISAYRVTTNNGVDVTSTTIKQYKSSDESVVRDYFIAPAGKYVLTAIAEDGTEKSKDIDVNVANTVVYDFTYFDLGTLNYNNVFAVGINEVLYFNNTNSSGQTVKLGKDTTARRLANWTIEYDVTDMSWSGQGKVIVTKNTYNSEGKMIGWEDLTIGGKPNEFWGFECQLATMGWVSYQWRSNWETPVTTEFMPDPNDHTKGCGRDASEYVKYLTGTHNFKLSCTMDDETKVCTYRYYIDGEIEAIHVAPEKHNDGNLMGFYQLSAERFNGLVSNFKVY